MPGSRSVCELLTNTSVGAAPCAKVRTLGNNQGLTNRECFGIPHALSVRGENLFPAFWRFIELPRNRDKRIAGLNGVNSASSFRRDGSFGSGVACLQFIRGAS